METLLQLDFHHTVTFGNETSESRGQTRWPEPSLKRRDVCATFESIETLGKMGRLEEWNLWRTQEG